MSFTLDGSINIPSPNGAIKCRNEYVLWQPGQVRGSDVVLAGVNGVLPRRRWLTATTHTLELIISGTVNVSEDETVTEPAEHLEINVAFMRETVCAPVATTAGTRALVVYMPSGGTLSGAVHVTNFRFGKVAEHAKWALATMDISIPGGNLTATP